MGLDVVFEFSDGSSSLAHMCYSSFYSKFMNYLSIEEYRKCVQKPISGQCSDRLLICKLHTMFLMKDYVQEEKPGHRRDFPIKMEFC